MESGLVSEFTVGDGAKLKILSGGTANEVTVLSGGSMVLSNGTANKTVLSGGSMVLSDGRVHETTISSDGILRLWEGTADDTTVSSGGSLLVPQYCESKRTIVLSGGTLFILRSLSPILSGGTAYDTTVMSGGTLVVDQKEYSVEEEKQEFEFLQGSRAPSK